MYGVDLRTHHEHCWLRYDGGERGLDQVTGSEQPRHPACPPPRQEARGKAHGSARRKD